MQTKTRSLFLFSAFIILLAITFTTPVLAVGKPDQEAARAAREAAREARTAEREARLEERVLQREEAKEERIAERCEAMAVRVTARLVRMEENRNVHLGNYERLVERLDEMIAKLDEEDLDTTELVAARDEIVLMIEEYGEVYSELLAELQAYEGDVCENVAGGRKGFLQGAKDFLHELIALRQDIRTFYRTDVRPAIKVLRDEAHDALVEEAEEGTESDD